MLTWLLRVTQGGRLTISPPAAIFESTYERLVLLLAGSVIECSARDALQAAAAGDSTREIKEGRIVGVVASRRAVSYVFARLSAYLRHFTERVRLFAAWGSDRVVAWRTGTADSCSIRVD